MSSGSTFSHGANRGNDNTPVREHGEYDSTRSSFYFEIAAASCLDLGLKAGAEIRIRNVNEDFGTEYGSFGLLGSPELTVTLYQPGGTPSLPAGVCICRPRSFLQQSVWTCSLGCIGVELIDPCFMELCLFMTVPSTAPPHRRNCTPLGARTRASRDVAKGNGSASCGECSWSQATRDKG